MSAVLLYLVRVWPEPGQHGDAAFRASVRPLDGERETLFTRPADLAHHLAHQLAQQLAQHVAQQPTQQPADGPPAPPGPPPDA